MAKNSQIIKGLLEGCILKNIEVGEAYGYKICDNLVKAGFKEINEGSVYKILIRLEEKGYITSIKKASPLGPMRKYFYLTDIGRDFFSEFMENWTIIQDRINYILTLPPNL